jgi:MoxR-like ATPase
MNIADEMLTPRPKHDWGKMEREETARVISDLIGPPSHDARGRTVLDCDQALDVARKAKEYRDDPDRGVIAESSKWLKGSRARFMLEILFQSILLGIHAKIIGISGIGKTRGVEVLCQVTNLPMTRYDGQPDTGAEELLGTQTYHDGKFSYVPGFITEPALVAVCDELPRIPATTASAFIQPMEEHQASVPDLGGRGRRVIKLPSRWTMLATGNPEDYGGQASPNLAVDDRFGLALEANHPDEESCLAMLSAANLVNPPIIETRPLPFALNAIHAALPHVALTEEQRKQIVSICTLITPPAFRRRHAIETTFFRPESRRAESMVKELNHLTAPNLREGGNPRGMQLIQSAAMGRALLDGRLHVRFDDLAFAARASLRYRIKAEHGCSDMVPEILDRALAIIFPGESSR